MAWTKVRPQRIEANNSPAVWQVPKYVDETTFERGDAGSGGWAVTYEIFDGTLTGLTPVDISDIRIDVDTPYNIYYETQPAGTITRTTTGGNIQLVSDNAGDTMNFRIVAFGFGSNSGYATWSTTLTGAGPWTVTDARIAANTPINLYPDTNVVGYLTLEASAWSFEITSTGTEVGTVVQWIAFTTTNNNLVSDEAYWPTWDNITDIAPSKNAVYDKIESIVWQTIAWTGIIFSGAYTNQATEITHNLNVLQADVEAGRYAISIVWTVWSPGDSVYFPIWRTSWWWNPKLIELVHNVRASGAATTWIANRQANSLWLLPELYNLNVTVTTIIITKLR